MPGMTKERANELRRRILSLGHLPAEQVAAQLGCGVSTVYKVRANPGADGRIKKRRGQKISAEIRQLAADDDLSIDDVTSALGDASTPVRPWRVTDAPGQPVEGDPYAALSLSGYADARKADPHGLAPEIALMRVQVRRVAARIEELMLANAEADEDDAIDQAATEARLIRLQEHLANLNETLARAVRAHAASERPTSPVQDALAVLVEDRLAARGL